MVAAVLGNGFMHPHPLKTWMKKVVRNPNVVFKNITLQNYKATFSSCAQTWIKSHIKAKYSFAECIVPDLDK